MKPSFLALVAILVSSPEIRAPRTERVTLGAPQDPTSMRIEYDADFVGTLHVWASHPTLAFELVGRDARGGTTARDAGSAAGATRYVKIDVSNGTELELEVRTVDAITAPAEVELTLIAVAESDASLEASASASKELAAVAELTADDEAVERLEKCVATLLAVEPPGESTRVARALFDAGVELQRRDRYESALPALEACRAHDERVLPQDQPELQVTRSRVGASMGRSGRFEESDAAYALAVDGWIRAGLARDDDLQRARAAWAQLLGERGEHARALELQREALAVWTETRSENDLECLGLQMNAGTTSIGLRDFGTATAVLRRVVEQCERHAEVDVAFRVRAQMNLGIALFQIGDAAGARERFEQVVAVRERELPADHPDVLRARTNLAIACNESGELARALEIQRDLLARWLERAPEDDPIVQGARRNLANTLERYGEHAEARELFEAACAAYERSRAPDDRELLDTRTGLASVLKKLGELDEAARIEEEVLSHFENALPSGHPGRVTLRRNLAWTRAIARDADGVARAVGPLLDEVAASLSSVDGPLSVREIEERALAARPTLSALISLVDGAGFVAPVPGRDRELLELIETVRTAGLRAASSSRARTDEVLRERTEALARLAASGAPPDEIAAARRAREARERELAERAAAVAEPAHARFELARDCVALAANELALVYASYTRNQHEATSPGGMMEVEHLCAFVVDRSGVARVELGPLGPIADLVQRWRAALGAGGVLDAVRGVPAQTPASAPDMQRALARELVRHVVAPLRPHLDRVDRLTVVPDDVLWLVPIDALEFEDGRIGDRWSVRVRTTLLRDSDSAPARDARLLVMGAIDYEDSLRDRLAVALPSSSASGMAAGTTRDVLRDGGVAGAFVPLPATGEEARALRDLAQEALGQQSSVVLLEGRSATRDRLAELAPTLTHLHLATHGYALSAQGESGAGRSALAPLLDCGLALAGANVADAVFGRLLGVVTGEELAMLDLSSCELAVLSACDTNVGERRAGQGVASLQKALQMAGARSVITSLWKVPDEATKELMLDFYRRLWVEKKPKHQALWEAKTKLREAKDERGEPLHTTRDWGAWVLTGDPN